MGANKFGPPGWQDDPAWRGWWGDNPPFHTPTYVLTHRPLPPMEMEGGTTFHFLDATPAEALHPEPCTTRQGYGPTERSGPARSNPSTLALVGVATRAVNDRMLWADRWPG